MFALVNAYFIIDKNVESDEAFITILFNSLGAYICGAIALKKNTETNNIHFIVRSIC